MADADAGAIGGAAVGGFGGGKTLVAADAADGAEGEDGEEPIPGRGGGGGGGFGVAGGGGFFRWGGWGSLCRGGVLCLGTGDGGGSFAGLEVVAVAYDNG